MASLSSTIINKIFLKEKAESLLFNLWIFPLFLLKIFMKETEYSFYLTYFRNETLKKDVTPLKLHYSIFTVSLSFASISYLNKFNSLWSILQLQHIQKYHFSILPPHFSFPIFTLLVVFVENIHVHVSCGGGGWQKSFRFLMHQGLILTSDYTFKSGIRHQFVQINYSLLW